MNNKNKKTLERLFNFISETNGLSQEELKKSFEQDGINIDGLKQKCFKFMHEKSEYYRKKNVIASLDDMTKDDLIEYANQLINKGELVGTFRKLKEMTRGDLIIIIKEAIDLKEVNDF